MDKPNNVIMIEDIDVATKIWSYFKADEFYYEEFIQLVRVTTNTDLTVNEWLFLNGNTKKGKYLIHLIEPVFGVYAFDSIDFSWYLTNPKNYQEVIKYNKLVKQLMNYNGVKIAGDSYINTLQKKPPHYIKPYVTKAGRKTSQILKSEYDNSCTYNIKCECGSIHFTIAGHKVEYNDFYEDPFFLECTSCHKHISLFNSHEHGYDGVLKTGEDKFDIINKEQNAYVHCNKCSGDSFEITVCFEHSVDKDEAKEIIKENKLRIGSEDLFSWFAAYACCESCRNLIKFCDIECA